MKAVEVYQFDLNMEVALQQLRQSQKKSWHWVIRLFSGQCSFDLEAGGERVDFGIWKDAAKFSCHCVRKQAGKLITQSFLFSLETKGFIAVLTIDGFPLSSGCSFETKAAALQRLSLPATSFTSLSHETNGSSIWNLKLRQNNAVKIA